MSDELRNRALLAIRVQDDVLLYTSLQKMNYTELGAFSFDLDTLHKAVEDYITRRRDAKLAS